MSCTLEKFLELLNNSREDDPWDFKRQIEISKKSEKYNLIKDFISFANYGGGYILVGVENDTRKIANVENEIDPSTLAEIIEKNTGLEIKFDIAYFSHHVGGDTLRVGLIYINPSDKLLACYKDLTSEDGHTVIVKANEIYTRRNTRSIKATPAQIEDIFYRIKLKKASEGDIPEDKYPVYNSKQQVADALWNLIDDKNVINAETTSINLRGLLWFSEHNKKDFARLCGIDLQHFERLLLGKEIPTLDFLLRVSKITGTPFLVFFEANYFGRKSFWKDDDLRFILLKLIKPITQLQRIENFNRFLGQVVYKTAKSILELHEFITSDSDVDGLSAFESHRFKQELSHQYYKLLEQVVSDYEFRGLTKTEEIITRWFHWNSQYLSRIFIESIKEIKVKDKDEPSIIFHFKNEITKKEIYGRTYDQKNLKIVFSAKRFPADLDSIQH